ncbi:MAG: hypothetical protein VX644_13845 [Planctomycetota bacterium]|nr:hypothetical protein [Planctomycetota bacterium]
MLHTKAVMWSTLMMGLFSLDADLLSQENAKPEGPGQATSRNVVVRSAGGGTFGYTGSTAQGLIGLKQIHEELKLDPRQVEKLKEIEQHFREQQQEMLKEYRNLDANKRVEFYREMQETFKENFKQELGEVLKPSQLKRLDQIQMQSTLRSRGNYVLYDPKIADLLEITDAQKKEIRTKAMEAQKKLNAEMMRLRQEMQEKLLDEVLTAAQKRKVKELTGDKYEMKPIEYRRFNQPGTEKKTDSKSRK